MGTLTYDVVSRVEFDDRALAHLQIVIASKFRRNESFNFSWVKDAAHGSGRVTVWMHPSIPLVYEFSGSRMPTINRLWLDTLMQTANSATGLHLVPETVEPPHDDAKANGTHTNGTHTNGTPLNGAKLSGARPGVAKPDVARPNAAK